MQHQSESQKTSLWRTLPWFLLVLVLGFSVATWAANSMPAAPPMQAPATARVAVSAATNPPDAALSPLNERINAMESAQRSFNERWLDSQRQTIDWWLTFVGVMLAFIAVCDGSKK